MIDNGNPLGRASLWIISAIGAMGDRLFPSYRFPIGRVDREIDLGGRACDEFRVEGVCLEFG